MRMPSEVVAKARARNCILARTLPEDDPRRVGAKQELKAALTAERLEKLVSEWPPLTAEQIDRLQGILGSAETLDPEAPDLKGRFKAAKKKAKRLAKAQAEADSAA